MLFTLRCHERIPRAVLRDRVVVVGGDVELLRATPDGRGVLRHTRAVPVASVAGGSKVRRRVRSVSNAIRAPKSVPNTPKCASKCV